MDQHRWKKLEDLFDLALKIAPDERSAFLDDACVGDEEMRSKLASMLSNANEAEDFLSGSAIGDYAEEIVASVSPVKPGENIGRYLILGRMGAGGMGEVWKAKDEALDREVAIKILPLEFVADDERIKQFRKEALALSALNHPNIVTIFETGHSDNVHFIAMELVEGQTLRHVITEAGLEWRYVVKVAMQVAEALHAAHTAKIIHRDIKPENMMVLQNGQVKVLDFGIAKRGIVAKDEKGNNTVADFGNQTQVGIITGTVNYMSPEQRRGELLNLETDPFSARTDIFSFGIVLYEMLAGRRPYDGLSDEEKNTALLSDEEIPSIREFCPILPAALDDLISRTLRKKREERCSAQDLITEFRELKSFIDFSEQKEGQGELQAKNANRLLTQAVTLYIADSKKYAPLNTIWSSWRYADLKFGVLEREVLRKSLRSALSMYGKWMLVMLIIAAAVGFAIARVMSVAPVWEEHLMRDGHSKWVHSIAFSPNGRLLVSVSDDKTVIVWDFVQRKRLKTLTDHTDRVNSIAFAPDGKWFATGSHDKTIIVWDAETLEKITTLRKHQDAVNAVAFSPDGKWLASASSGEPVSGSDFRTVLWDTSNWEKTREIRRGVVYGPLLFSSDSRLLMTNQVQWDLVSDKLIANDDLPENQKFGTWNWAAISPNAKTLVSTNSIGEVIFRELTHPDDLTNSRLIQESRAHQDFGRAVAFSPDGKLVATGTDVILLWDTATRKIISRFDEISSVWSLAFSPDGRWLVSAHGDGSIQVRDLNDRHRTVGFDGHGDHVLVVASSPNGKRIATAGKDGAIILWQAESEQKETVLFGHETRVVNLAFSPDGTWLASFDQDGYLIRWDIEKHLQQWKVQACRGTECLAISQDGKWIANTCRIYESSQGQEIGRWDEKQTGFGMADGAAFSPDGKSLAIVGGQKIVLLDAQNRQTMAKQEASSNVTRISFSSDSSSLLTGTEDGRLIWWDMHTLNKNAEVTLNKAAVSAMAFSLNGKMIAAADKDEIVIWDANSRKKISTIGPQAIPAYSFAFSSDGNRLFVAKRDRTIRVYTHHLERWGKRLD